MFTVCTAGGAGTLTEAQPLLLLLRLLVLFLTMTSQRACCYPFPDTLPPVCGLVRCSTLAHLPDVCRGSPSFLALLLTKAVVLNLV